MRKTLGSVLAGALVLAWTAAAWSGEGEDARGVIARAIKAAGGEKNLAKHQSMTWNEKGTYYGMGKGLPFESKLAIQMPDKFRMDILGVFTVVYNGDKGWIVEGGETKAMSKQQHEAQQIDHRAGSIASLLPLKDKAFKLTLLDEAKVDGKPAVGVKVTRTDYPEVKLYFDKKTHLLVKTQWQSRAAEQKFKEVTAEMHYSKYQEIEGAQVPTRVVLNRDGELFVEADISDLKTVNKHEPGTFDKP